MQEYLKEGKGAAALNSDGMELKQPNLVRKRLILVATLHNSSKTTIFPLHGSPFYVGPPLDRRRYRPVPLLCREVKPNSRQGRVSTEGDERWPALGKHHSS